MLGPARGLRASAGATGPVRADQRRQAAFVRAEHDAQGHVLGGQLVRAVARAVRHLHPHQRRRDALLCANARRPSRLLGREHLRTGAGAAVPVRADQRRQWPLVRPDAARSGRVLGREFERAGAGAAASVHPDQCGRSALLRTDSCGPGRLLGLQQVRADASALGLLRADQRRLPALMRPLAHRQPRVLGLEQVWAGTTIATRTALWVSATDARRCTAGTDESRSANSGYIPERWPRWAGCRSRRRARAVGDACLCGVRDGPRWVVASRVVEWSIVHPWSGITTSRRQPMRPGSSRSTQSTGRRGLPSNA